MKKGGVIDQAVIETTGTTNLVPLVGRLQLSENSRRVVVQLGPSVPSRETQKNQLLESGRVAHPVECAPPKDADGGPV